MEHPYTGAVVAAAGSSSRMGQDKQFLRLQGKEVLLRSMETLTQCPLIAEVVVVCHPQRVAEVNALCAEIPSVVAVVPGGNTRQESVEKGIQALSLRCQLLCVHDGARPLLRQQDLEQVLRDGARFGAATLGVRQTSTLKRVDTEGFVVETLNREQVFQIQTPQVFWRSWYLEGLQKLRLKKKTSPTTCSFWSFVAGGYT